MEQIWVCSDCLWTTSNADGEEDSHSQRYLHTVDTGHRDYEVGVEKTS